MGSNNSKIQIDKKTQAIVLFDEYEKAGLQLFYSQFYANEQLNLKTLLEEVFLILAPLVQPNIVSFLNSYYSVRDRNKTADKVDINDFLMLAHILLKANSDSDDSIYFKINIFFIIYDITKGKIEAYKDITCIKDIISIFGFVMLIYINKYENQKHKTDNPFTEDFNCQLTEYLTANINAEQNNSLSYLTIKDYVDNQLYALNGFIKTNLRGVLLKKDNDFISQFPKFNEPPSVISMIKFFFFCLATPNVSNKSYAFKLFSCKVQGYNVSDLIYSFMGFPGPVVIMVQHFDKEGEEIVVGMYINGNFKECYEKFCGDDMSFIFTLGSKMTLYKYRTEENICFICSRNQKYSKVQPGIGMGYNKGSIRFWLDMNELFSKSHFGKYDDVFEEGSPFNDAVEKLNVFDIFIII